MEHSDIVLRNLTYSRFVETGAAPSAARMARAAGCSESEVVDAWRRLHDQHALVLNAERTEIRMANPFSAVPTAYRVRARSRWWYANCAWDAFGICAALHADGTIESSCPDCGETISVAVQTERPSREDLLFHCLVPARSWWDDIVFT